MRIDVINEQEPQIRLQERILIDERHDLIAKEDRVDLLENAMNTSVILSYTNSYIIHVETELTYMECSFYGRDGDLVMR